MWKMMGESIEGAARMGFAFLTPWLRDKRCRWGATEAELESKMPGDELVPQPKWGWTHAITIQAPAAEVWPWVVQMGQKRGGFYSYEGLENLAGCNIHNADRILADFQNLQAGDCIYLHPEVAGLPVVAVEPNQALVIHALTDPSSGDPFAPAKGTPEKYGNMLWTFLLEERGDGSTRLFSRARYDHSPDLSSRLMFGASLLEPIGGVMDRRMLLGIKERVEARASEG
jgi:hypothetical protein